MEYLIAVSTTLVAIISLMPIADRVGLVDIPSTRKQHSNDVPLIGGIAIFLGTLTACLISMPTDTSTRLFLISSALTVFIGALDDLHDLSVRLRLIAQLIIASIFVYGAGIHLDNLGNLFYFTGDIQLGLIVGSIVTIIAVLGAINAFNMSDGMDGLTGVLAINTLCTISFLYFLNGQMQQSTLPMVIGICIIPFLIFNLGLIPGRVHKIFMGDSGSMFIGLSIIWVLTLATRGESPAIRAVTALWVIAIPLMDMVAIMLRRYKKGHSPFKPDRNHLHHILLNKGFSETRVLLSITLLASSASLVGILGELYQIPEYLMFLVFIATFYIYHKTLDKYSQAIASKSSKEEAPTLDSKPQY